MKHNDNGFKYPAHSIGFEWNAFKYLFSLLLYYYNGIGSVCVCIFAVDWTAIVFASIRWHSFPFNGLIVEKKNYVIMAMSSIINECFRWIHTFNAKFYRYNNYLMLWTILSVVVSSCLHLCPETRPLIPSKRERFNKLMRIPELHTDKLSRIKVKMNVP